MEENDLQNIAKATAQTTSQAFLHQIPSDVLQTLPLQFCSSLQKGLQSELQELIQSRLSWSKQSILLKLAETQQLQTIQNVEPEPPQSAQSPQSLTPVSQLQSTHGSSNSKPATSRNTNPIVDPPVLSDLPQAEPKATRRRCRTPKLSREEIIQQYNLEDFVQPRESGTMRRRRRRRAASP